MHHKSSAAFPISLRSIVAAAVSHVGASSGKCVHVVPVQDDQTVRRGMIVSTMAPTLEGCELMSHAMGKWRCRVRLVPKLRPEGCHCSRSSRTCGRQRGVLGPSLGRSQWPLTPDGPDLPAFLATPIASVRAST